MVKVNPSDGLHHTDPPARPPLATDGAPFPMMAWVDGDASPMIADAAADDHNGTSM